MSYISHMKHEALVRYQEIEKQHRAARKELIAYFRELLEDASSGMRQKIEKIDGSFCRKVIGFPGDLSLRRLIDVYEDTL